MVDDIQLYLDTHPDDEEALAYFHKYKEQRVKALKEYAACYGPLTIDTVDESCGDRWTWINELSTWQGKEGADLCGIMKKDFSFR